MRTPVEVLYAQPTTPRSDVALKAVVRAAQGAGHPTTTTRAYEGGSPWLLLWGPGAPDRREAMKAQQAAGGHSIVLDLAYWQRESKFRVSLDAAHPQAYVMARNESPRRLRTDGILPSDEWDLDGPVIIAGLGTKARVQYGDAFVDEWEARMAFAAWGMGKRKVLYRHKAGHERGGRIPEACDGATPSSRPIAEVLRGASALVTYHSNVAIDALRQGIPVICADGAAAAVCPRRWPEDGTSPVPLDPAVRDQFLANLAHWQYSVGEAPACWRFVCSHLDRKAVAA